MTTYLLNMHQFKKLGSLSGPRAIPELIPPQMQKSFAIMEIMSFLITTIKFGQAHKV